MVARIRHDADAHPAPASPPGAAVSDVAGRDARERHTRARTPLTRRALFRRSVTPAHTSEPIRPPWALREDAFLDRCSRCARCVDACEPGVLRLVRGYPEADFRTAECTFCGACADACRDGALDARALASGTPPWTLEPEIASGCLAPQGVLCRTCGDVCDARAIRFRPRVGGPPHPEVSAAACTGCGACVAACPSRSITLTPVAPAD